MTNSDQLRIFIGSSDYNYIEQQVLIYSVKKLSTKKVRFFIIDCTDLKVYETDGFKKEIYKDFSQYKEMIKSATNFSWSRFLIPMFCDYQGGALYLDSDIILHTDIHNLLSQIDPEAHFSCVPVSQASSSFYYKYDLLETQKMSHPDTYLTSVMYINNEKMKDISFERIHEHYNKDFIYHDIMFLSPKFRDFFSLKVSDLAGNWNHLDVSNSSSKITHYTDLTSQPWRSNVNFTSMEWDNFLKDAIEAGYVKKEELDHYRKIHYINLVTYLCAQIKHRTLSSLLRLISLIFFLPLRLIQCFKAYSRFFLIKIYRQIKIHAKSF